jgi:hypothetical protein
VSDWLVPALEEILRRARSERRAARAGERYERTLRQVEGYLAADPEASANRVYAEIGGRRQDVLRATRAARARFLSDGNHRSGVAP